MKNMNELAKFICSLEGKKSQMNIGDVKEILGVLSDLIYGLPGVYDLLRLNGKKRVAKVLNEGSKLLLKENRKIRKVK